MIQVVKRDGSKEPLNIEKIHKVVEFACEGISGVSPSEVEIQSKLQFYNNIKTNDIHETLINAAGKLISEDSPNYQFVAARLLSYHLRKQVYGSYKPDKLFSHYKKIRDLGFYTTELGTAFTPEEWAELNSYIKHERDDIIPFIGMEQFRSKYLVRNRATKEILETPQMAMMLIAMTLIMDDKHDDINVRIDLIKEFYDVISTYEATLPSPIMAGVRTPEKQFASCILVDSDDSLDSIIATNGVIVKYVSKKAGLGIGATKLRAVNDPVRGGAVVHTGSIPFIKTFESSVLSCSQGSIRRGSGTVNLLGWHLEFEEHIALKSNKGTEENSVRQLDYVVQLNRVLYERLLTGGNITLFSPKDHPEMYDAFYTDVDKFRDLYEKAERSRCRKKTISAEEYFSALIRERKETGRVYIMNVDNVNNQSGYIKERCPVVMTNLCVEINQFTKALEHLFDPDGEIALCTLAALNVGKLKTPEDFQRVARILVRALDNLLSYQDYLLPAAENCGKKRRSVGIGITNFAYWMAKNNLLYSDPDLNKVEQLAEMYSYAVIKASNDLAIERGACEKVDDSIYSLGQVPWMNSKKEVSELTNYTMQMDWPALSESLKKNGIRNYPLMAGMPVETSSAPSNSTNAFEPIRSIITYKGSKDHMVAQVAPEARKLKNKYETKWSLKSPEGYLKINAIFQKYMDQAISVNTFYNPEHYPDNEIPESVLIKDIVNHYKWGGKTLYYFEVHDGAGEENDEEVCESCSV